MKSKMQEIYLLGSFVSVCIFGLPYSLLATCMSSVRSIEKVSACLDRFVIMYLRLSTALVYVAI